MNKKYIILLATLLLAVVVGITTVALVNQANAKEYFPESGYILGSDDEKKVSFTKETEFNASQLGTVSFKNLEGDTAVLEAGSFVHMEDGSVMALDDGILLDFSDLSSNFINNYYITRTLSITETGSGYTAETDSGSLTFGEYLWKLSDNKYMICSSAINVYFSDDDIREVSNFVEISVTSDGIVEILTEDNVWMTISDQCYIETANGVRINPLTHVIDDGTYQITTSKLVVSADDSIVLTEDETRRQIVPELNIDAVDGEDGEDGVLGEDGTSGEDGTLGEDGVDGAVGAEGASGEDGASGASGAAGSSGVNGANGTKGVDATHESSINTALPTMTITDWNVTSTSLQATIGVGGGTETLEVTGTTLNDYNGWITITNVATGEIVYCYQTEDDYYTNTVGELDYEISKFKSAVDVSFTTFDYTKRTIDVLTPDTEYKLSVNAYYTINDVIYSREFISRTFYTDSTGLQMSCEDTTIDSATVEVNSSMANSATLYILTEAQNATFTLGSTSDQSNYTASASWTDSEESVIFTGLNPDTKYIVRAVVSVDGSTILTNQELELRTLKTIPTWEATDTPTAYYNRINGMFEVFRPVVTDAYDGVSYYVYTVYNTDGTIKTSKTVYPSDAEPVAFYLATDTWYAFGVEMYFDDNEKVTVYDLGVSEYILSEGSSLPKVTWTDTLNTKYDDIQGTIRITLDGTSKIEISENQPLTIEVYANQVIEKTVQLTPNHNTDGVLATDNYNINYTAQAENTNYIDINVEFDNLLENTNYTFTVSGFIDLDDGNGAINRTLGYVSTYTYETNALTATFTSQDSSNAFSINFAMNVQSSTSGGSEPDYVKEELAKGSVTLDLYQGTGNTRTYLGTTVYSAGSQDIVNIYYGTGVTVTENSFNQPNLTASSNYTLVISEVVDDTGSMNLGYVNEFDTINPSSFVVTANATPPDLLAEPTGGIDAVPIYNIDAPNYGAQYVEDMPDDAIIGYYVKSTYDNSQRLATKITYYAFEYSEFYNALGAGQDPLVDDGGTNDAKKLETFTITTSNQSDTLPEIAVFFNDVTFSQPIIEGSTTSNGIYIYQITQNETTANNTTAFTRGYRYIFAYTVEYVANTSDTTTNNKTYTYPNDHSDYAQYADEVACGIEMGSTVGADKGFYVLNSGMLSAPKTMPEFATYVYETTPSASTTGTVTLHYTYDDSDGAIIDTGNDDDRTQVLYPDTSGFGNTDSIAINKEPATDSDGVVITDWYQMTILYTVTQGQDVLLQPEVEISDYLKEYDDILSALSNNTYVAEPVYLAQIPVEYSYKQFLEDSNNENRIRVTMDISEENLNNNYITFTLDQIETAESLVLSNLMARAYVMELIFTITDGAESTFYVPITTTTGVLNSTYSAKFSTSQLSDILGEEFTVEANVIYDDGRQGWNLVDSENSGMFGLQRINSTGTEEFGYQAQYVATTGDIYLDSLSKNGGLLKTTYSGDLLEAIRTTAFEENLITTNFMSMTTSRTLTRYLTTEHYGVSDTTYPSVDYVSDNYIVPKGASTYALQFSTDDGSNSGQVDTITPTVGSISYTTGATQLTIRSFTVEGFDQIVDGNVTLSIYEDEDMNVLVGTGVVFEQGKFTQNSSGSYTYTYTATDENDTNVGIRLPGDDISGAVNLKQDTEYYLVFTAKIGSDEIVLLDTVTTDPAIYPFETIDGVKITPDENGIYYNNNSYTDKSLEFKYTLNTYQGVTVEYDIFAVDNIKESNGVYSVIDDDEEEIYMTHQELLDAGIASGGALGYINNIVFNLAPGEAREKLVPGTTYYLRITAYAGGEKSSTQILQFTITAIGNINAVITVNQVTQDSISYFVSIVDNQKSLMSKTGKSSYYVVRFTDENNNRILTTYDSIIYSTDSIKKEFILNQENLSNQADTIDPSTTYKMYVYGVIDANHNGESYPIASKNDSGDELDQDTVKTIDYFADSYDQWTGLTNLVNSFWVEDGEESRTNKESMDIVEDNFAIGNKIQITTDENNLLVDTSLASFSLNASSNIELTLSESSGVVTVDEYGDETQAFSKIEYSIDGYEAATGFGVSHYGISETPDELFSIGTDVIGFNIFTYVIPETVPIGKYNVTVKLYRSGVSEAYATISGSVG
ncbi:MAG: hypothetical protein R3Y24_13195 [Eubacteriales bacterium]